MKKKRPRQPIPPLKKRSRYCFCDTTIIYHRLHGHDLSKDAVRRLADGRALVLSNFTRGEYIRGYIAGLILLFFAIRAEKSVDNGIQVFLAENGRRPRRIRNALEHATRGFQGQEASEDIEITLRRLGESIRMALFRLDEEFPTRRLDPLACEIGVLGFPSATYSEDDILDFYAQFERITDKPSCKQCDFRAAKQTELSAAAIDLYGPDQQQKYTMHKGYVQQAERLAEAMATKRTAPSCWYCDRLGDSIIALSSPADCSLLTSDKASFPALATILGIELIIVPSLNELLKECDS